ncbi:PilZ domain-containing protein [Sulfuriflexus mobilis]|uniref:PilZ domain-containing protein n=1 Tax=Sulfuriflexus mobilis TaxID=1811807 RepID=UPI000F8486F5|nr:PilZ domain-containing protein [Sulfuriflexus mobilis]
MVDSNDGRDFRRMDIDCEVVVRRITEDVIIHARATNLSATGLMFSCATALNLDEELEIRINPGQEGLTPPLHAMARVVRVEGDEASSGFAIGCVITEMVD